MKRILVPVDFSNCSINAAKYACNIAQKTPAILYFLNAYRLPLESILAPGAVQGSQADLAFEKAKNADKQFSTYIKKVLKAEFGESLPPMQFELEYGFAADVILGQAESKQVDLIVMGTKGADENFDHFFGSVTSNIIKNTTRPVLAVPIQAKTKPIHKIAYATNFEEKDVEVLEQLVSFAGDLGAGLECIHIESKNGKDNFYQAWSMMEQVKTKGLNRLVIHNVQKNNIEEGIQKFVDENEVDLIALLTRKKSFLEKLLTGSLTKKLALHSNVPILAYH